VSELPHECDGESASTRQRFDNKDSGAGPMSLREMADILGVSVQSVDRELQAVHRRIEEIVTRKAAAEGMTIRQWAYGVDDEN
jgi:hypothetical protein